MWYLGIDMVKRTDPRAKSDLGRNICGTYILNNLVLVMNCHGYNCVQVNGHTRSNMTYYVG